MQDNIISPKRLVLNGIDGKPKIGLGQGTAFEIMKAHFPDALDKIRIASAYFTASGYKLARKYIPDGVKLWILVGKEDGRNVLQTVMEDIRDDLAHSDEDLWHAVNDLVQKLQSGEFQIVDARAMQIPFHCKFYLIDNTILLHGSANFSKRGLLQSIEQVGTSKEKDDIEAFSSRYQMYYDLATPLTQELIDLLLKFLQLASPFEIYLKTLLTLNFLPDREIRAEGNRPIYYQKAVVALALRQINKWGGSIIVAATGLGKTVMGAEVAFQLQATEQIKRAILLSPAGNVQESWKNELDARDIPYNCFTNSILFQENRDKKGQHQVSELDRKLNYADENTLIIIDEAHIYRNQLLSLIRKGHKSRVIARLERVVNEQGVKIVLLTATPYSTSILNLNSILALLPHKKPLMDFWATETVWNVKTVDEFVNLPMCTVIGLPHVIKLARQRGDIDDKGRVYIQFHDSRRYMPKQLNLLAPRYELPIDKQFENAWQAGCFDQLKKGRNFIVNENARTARDATSAQIDYIRNISMDAWLSSPVALRASVERNLLTPDPSERNDILWGEPEKGTMPHSTQKEESPDDLLEDISQPYNTLLKLRQTEREKYLLPLRDGLKDIEDDLNKDGKLQTLLKILDDRCKKKSKAIIFTCFRITTSYLKDAISLNRPGLKVDSTVSGKFLKSVHERQRLQKSLAPKANRLIIDDAEALDVLILTDADGVGVNLQDADTVISYDLPREADKIIQRVGRILRPTEDKDRQVYLYVLLPKEKILDEGVRNVLRHVEDRFDRITRRHDRAQQILNAPVIPQISKNMKSRKEIAQEIHLDREIDVNALIESNVDVISQLADGDDTSPTLKHQAILEDPKNKAIAEGLSNNISSVRVYSGDTLLTYTLVEDGSSFEKILYDFKQKTFLEKEETEVLDLIACDPSTQKAFVTADKVERLVNFSVRKWCEQNGKSSDVVKKVCSLLLVPEKQSNIDNFLENLVEQAY